MRLIFGYSEILPFSGQKSGCDLYSRASYIRENTVCSMLISKPYIVFVIIFSSNYPQLIVILMLKISYPYIVFVIIFFFFTVFFFFNSFKCLIGINHRFIKFYFKIVFVALHIKHTCVLVSWCISHQIIKDYITSDNQRPRYCVSILCYYRCQQSVSFMRGSIFDCGTWFDSHARNITHSVWTGYHQL